MGDNTIAIVTSVCALIAGLLSPLILAIAYLIKNISSSECCMSRVDVNNNNHNIELQDLSGV